ncbi:MAG TPA: hypothetical protein VFB96_20900 [Pirellulaceae bacterium]|jgi:hypothetical protein|nr:hypothetical protein [Pirellulaceae bacterium]
MKRLVRQLVLAALSISLTCSTAFTAEPVKGRREELLRQMRSLAEETKIKCDGSDCQPELVKSPVFRYDDQPRRFIDATVWAWTSQGYPVAFQKIEAKLHQSTGEPQWGYCFTSLTEDKLSVEWSSGRTFRSTEPGISWDLVPAASAPASRSADRRRQARDIVRGFAGRIVIDPKTNRSAEMRLLPTPMFEYDDVESSLLRGAVFGFVVYGTNPDVLVLLEVRNQDGKSQWHFAAARLTTGGITLNYQEKKVWEAEFVRPGTAPYPTWTFFPTPRTPVAGEETP